MFGWFRKKQADSSPGAPPAWMISAQWAARARWITHFCDFAGDPSNEWSPNPGMELPNRPDFLILEYAPQDGRDYWTYLTAGLAFIPQRPGSEMPHIEFAAYSPVCDARVAEFLFMLSHDVATAGNDEPTFKAFDLWGAEFYGLLNFLFAPAREVDELLDFPNRDKRKEDERYLLATTGELDGAMQLNLLQLVPLTVDEWKKASEHGSVAFLNEINWDDQPKTYGWSAIAPLDNAPESD